MEKEWVLGNKKGCCKICNHRLKSKETQDSVLLVCLNQKCHNHFAKQGCEIIMMLK